MKLKLQLLEAQLETQIARALLYAGALGKWMLTSVIVGVLCGLLGTAFRAPTASSGRCRRATA